MHRRSAVVAVSSLIAALGMVSSASVAGADPVAAGNAYAFGTTASLAGEEVVPPTPESTMVLPPGGEDPQTAVEIPAGPLAVSGTFDTNATVHAASDVASALEVDTQGLAGPYNATAVSTVEDLNAILGEGEVQTAVVEADLIRAEAVGVCTGGQVQYDATTEVVNLALGGSDVPLNGPLEELLGAIDEQLEDLADLVDVEFNVVTPLPAGGISVDALVITVLAAAGEAPLAEVVIGHAEVSGLTCDIPECRDGIDNDGDGVIDFPADPGCENPDDDDETDLPECSDTMDNDGDGVIDANDPGCHTDGDPNNPATYDPNDDDETDVPECSDTRDNDGDGKIDFGPDPGCSSPQDDSEEDVLPRTGGSDSTGVGLAAGLALAAVAGLAARRRLFA